MAPRLKTYVETARLLKVSRKKLTIYTELWERLRWISAVEELGRRGVYPTWIDHGSGPGKPP